MALALMDLETLEMAKKRDHKIMITDEAIEKVPYIRYKEIPEEEYPIIQMLAKKVRKYSEAFCKAFNPLALLLTDTASLKSSIAFCLSNLFVFTK